MKFSKFVRINGQFLNEICTIWGSVLSPPEVKILEIFFQAFLCYWVRCPNAAAAAAAVELYVLENLQGRLKRLACQSPPFGKLGLDSVTAKQSYFM